MGAQVSSVLEWPKLPNGNPFPANEPAPFHWKTFRSKQHPFEILLPSDNVTIVTYGEETEYTWIAPNDVPPTADRWSLGYSLIRVTFFPYQGGENGSQAIKRLEFSRDIGKEGPIFHGISIRHAWSTRNGITTVNRQLMWDIPIGWISYTVAHPTGVYHVRALVHKSAVTQEELDRVKSSFHLTQ